MKPRRRFRILVRTMLVVFVLVIAAWIKFLLTPLVTDPQGYQYTVREGVSMGSVIEEWSAENIIKNPYFFKLLVRLKGAGHSLKAGEYLFVKGTRPLKLLHQVVTGTGMVHHAFTIVPGWNFRELRQFMQQDIYFHHTLDKLSDAELMKKMGSATLSPEGQFFPDTYYFTNGSDDVVVLKRAYKAMQDKLNQAWEHRVPNLPYKSSYEALIAASIIEKEAKVPAELPQIAGVLVNRLRKEMRLQFDPTVIYGIGARFDGVIRRSDLSANNPYNTYVIKGLPPTPIAMPGLAAIEAALHPVSHSFYYFVARGNGTHQFSQSLNEHNKAVEVARKTVLPFFNYSLARFYLKGFL